MRKLLPAILSMSAAALLFSCAEKKTQTTEVKKDSEEIPSLVAHLKTTPDEDFDTMRPYMTGDKNYPIVFNDSNRFQYLYAEALGITPLEDINDAVKPSRELKGVTSNENFEVAELTHSVPYLVPEAEKLLHSIGKEFNARASKAGAPGRKIIVTSLLRTKASVKKLRRVNVNATDSSTHMFGTTFDIAWNGFAGEGGNLSDDALRKILAEVLYDKRRNMECLVKFEKKTHCFHITATH